MTETIEKVVDALENVEGSHEDFVVGVALFANDFGIVEELTNRIEATPLKTRNEVMRWIKKRMQLSPTITIDGASG